MKIYDLSQTLSSATALYPGDPEFTSEPAASLELNGCNLTRLTFGSHTGTHCDAPKHFIADGTGVDALALSHFIGKAKIIDLSVKDGIICVSELEDKLAGTGPDCRILMIRTGREEFIGKNEYFTGIPSFDRDITPVLRNHDIITLALDYPSVELNGEPAEIHRSLLGAGIAIIEGLCGLSQITEKSVFFCGAPLKISGCDGAPIRAAAVVF